MRFLPEAHAFGIVQYLSYLLNVSVFQCYPLFLFRTEFTDCLGRTRKCLKTDLELYLDKDKELMRIINKEQIYDKAVGNAEVKQTNEFL